MARKTAIFSLSAAGLLALALALPISGAHAQVNAENAQSVSNVLMAKGTSALENDEADQAINFLEQSVTAYPRNARAFGHLGHAHETAGDLEKARKYYAIALAIDPEDRKALLWDGQAALEEDDMDAAQERLASLERLCDGRCVEFRTLTDSIKAKEAALAAAGEDGTDTDEDGDN